MKTFTIYGQTKNAQPDTLVRITGKVAPKVMDILFQYVVAKYDYLYDDIGLEEDNVI